MISTTWTWFHYRLTFSKLRQGIKTRQLVSWRSNKTLSVNIRKGQTGSKGVVKVLLRRFFRIYLRNRNVRLLTKHLIYAFSPIRNIKFQTKLDVRRQRQGRGRGRNGWGERQNKITRQGRCEYVLLTLVSLSCQTRNVSLGQCISSPASKKKTISKTTVGTPIKYLPLPQFIQAHTMGFLSLSLSLCVFSNKCFKAMMIIDDMMRNCRKRPFHFPNFFWWFCKYWTCIVEYCVVVLH